MREVKVYDPSALESAFYSYLGTTRHCMNSALHAKAIVQEASTAQPDGTLDVRFDAWARAMNILSRLPYGGRWVNQARWSFNVWLTKALTPPQGTQLELF